ncbi:hypothetical protein SY91_06591 [Burkholderia cenocepacia]|uniref:hypothetical protein n=1 Tax=Burkholderia cenocepacia TaxID=95486 RepID=UPI001860669F|nr:hypothetical protein [Burkholderia cenocepacia]QND99123.1 hypothetical protein SY91_06591 [Burkholderia cenocepacia]
MRTWSSRIAIFACAEDDRGTTALLTVVDGKIVWGAGPFASHDAPIPPAMPDWSPVREFGAWRLGATQRDGAPLQRAAAAAMCACANALLTVVDGKIVWGAGPFASHDAPIPPAMPDWSPVREFGGYGGWGATQRDGAPLQRAAARDVRLRERMQRSPTCARGRVGPHVADVGREGFLGRVRVLVLGGLISRTRRLRLPGMGPHAAARGACLSCLSSGPPG